MALYAGLVLTAGKDGLPVFLAGDAGKGCLTAAFFSVVFSAFFSAIGAAVAATGFASGAGTVTLISGAMATCFGSVVFTVVVVSTLSAGALTC